jgi:hypothetical protein
LTAHDRTLIERACRDGFEDTALGRGFNLTATRPDTAEENSRVKAPAPLHPVSRPGKVQADRFAACGGYLIDLRRDDEPFGDRD